MNNHNKNSTRPAPETKDAFARTVRAGAFYLRACGHEKLALRLEAMLSCYEPAKLPFSRAFTAAYGSMLSYIRVNCIHYERKDDGHYGARHGRDGTADLLYALTREVAPQGVLVGDTAEDQIDNLYVEYAHKLAEAIAKTEEPAAVLAAIDYTTEELSKESTDYEHIQQMSCFRALVQELTGKNSGYMNTLRWLPPEYDDEVLADLDGLTLHLHRRGLYDEAVILARLTLDCAMKLCGSEDERTLAQYTSFAQILAETGDYLGAAEYGFAPFKVRAKKVIIALQDADNKTQWQNKDVDTFMTELERYINLLKLVQPKQSPGAINLDILAYWRHCKSAQELLQIFKGRDINAKSNALLPLLCDAA